ncbi:restriction endonuclease subunit S [Stenotrophomonas humi]
MEIDLCAIAPADWEIKSVADVCQRITSGGTPSRRESVFYDGGVWPWVKTQELQDGWIDDTDEHITEAAVAASSAKVLPANTILLAMYGATVGQLGILRRSMTCNQACCALIADPDKADFRFLHFQLLQIRSELKNLATGAAQQNLSGAVIKTLRLPFPPIEEQRAVAHILGTLDDKIELNRKQNETLEAMARALFKAWFVDFEPVRAKLDGRWQRGQSLPGLPAHLYDIFPDQFVDSELGEIPKGWAVLPAYELARYVNGATFKALQANDERRGLPIIKIAELKAGVTAQTKFSDVAMPEKYGLRTGDILFSWSGNPDTSIDTFIWAHGDAWLNQHIFRVDVDKQSERAFVIATLKYLRPVFTETARNKQTTGLGHVTVGDMKSLLVVKPDERIMAAWDRVAAPIFSAAFRNEADSISVRRLRDTLLPKLISGELRVPDAERIAGDI